MKIKISKIAEIRSGFLFKDGISPDKEGDVSVIQLRNIDERGVLDTSDLQRVSLQNANSINFIAMGDVLFKAKTNHPVSTIVKEPVVKTIATAHYFIITVKDEKVLPGYLAWYLNQRPAQMYFEKNAGGTRIQVVNKQLLGDLEITIPSRNIQENIERIFDLHQRENSLIDALQEKKKKFISSQLLTASSH